MSLVIIKKVGPHGPIPHPLEQARSLVPAIALTCTPDAMTSSWVPSNHRPRREADRTHFDKTIAYAEADAMRCAGRLDEAATLYKRGLDLAKLSIGAAVGGGGGGVDKRATVIKLNSLVEVLNWGGRATEAAAVAAEAALLAGWTDPMQRPVHHFDRTIEGPGWREAAEDMVALPGYSDVVVLLEDAARELRLEYASLRKRKLLRRQTECLHDQSSGAWSHFPVVGDESADGLCSKAAAAITPAACSLLDKIQTIGNGGGGGGGGGGRGGGNKKRIRIRTRSSVVQCFTFIVLFCFVLSRLSPSSFSCIFFFLPSCFFLALPLLMTGSGAVAHVC